MSTRKGSAYLSVLVETQRATLRFHVHDELYLIHSQVRHKLDGIPVVLMRQKLLSCHYRLLQVPTLRHELMRLRQSYPKCVVSIIVSHP